MQLFIDLANALKIYSDANAFFIDGSYYTYKELATRVSAIRESVQRATEESEKIIGLIINDDLETYAAIVALWLDGRAYVPVNPETPVDRNNRIIHQAGIRTIIDSSLNQVFSGYQVIRSKELPETADNLSPMTAGQDELAYIFFTSGTTGEPKGVPITRGNVTGFIDAFWDLGISVDRSDRVLQMFELTFDLSVMSYLVPLLRGACVYTIPKGAIKYQYIAELLEEHQLTVALMVPSILHYLRPYFDEIHAPDMRFSLFCGEALPLDVTQEWSKCLPNAEIRNVYGPTENTIFCTNYTYNHKGQNKEHNGVLCIGKPMKGVEIIIVDENNQMLGPGEKGELCLAGELLTPGYWNNPEKNMEAFFEMKYNGRKTRFYKTGDLCVQDHEGDILYLGRIDFQTKIQGFRVELSEIEFHARTYLGKVNAVAVAFTNQIGNTEIGLAIESRDFEIRGLIDFLKTKLPQYMIPTKTQFYRSFPLNVNGKTDRKEITKIFNN